MADDASSDSSSISEHYADAHPELVNARPVVYKQQHHPANFKRLSLAPGTMMEEAFPGAFHTVNSLSPDLYEYRYGVGVASL